MLKPPTTYDKLESLDIRIGRIIAVDDSRTRKPTYRITVDFGPEVGIKTSCGAYTCYRKDELIGKQIVAIVNLPIKRMGPENSEVLIFGATSLRGTVAYLLPESDALPGEIVF